VVVQVCIYIYSSFVVVVSLAAPLGIGLPSYAPAPCYQDIRVEGGGGSLVE
jgi:hypothetical protein